LNCARPPALSHRRAASFSRSPTSPCWPDRFTIIDNRGSDPVFGTFLGLPERAVFTNGTIAFEITYLGGDGNDVVLARLAPPRPPCPTPPLFIRRLTNNAVELSWPSCPSNFYQLAWTANFNRWEMLTPPLAGTNPTPAVLPSRRPRRSNRSMAVLMVRGGLDAKRPFNGGPNIDGVETRSAMDDVAYWTTGSSCVGAPVVTSAPGVMRWEYGACAGTTEVILVRVDALGHAWPDAPPYNANVQVIDFLLAHSR
jgi:hypothetical protein